MLANTKEIRRERLWELLKEHNDNRADLSLTLKKAAPQVSQWLHGQRSISEDSAREIERNARKPAGWMDQSAKAPKGKAAEDSPSYAANDWPLQSVTAHQLRRLPATGLRLVEDHIKLVLAMSASPTPTNSHWRTVALELAAHADAKTGLDAFTKFCVAVDRKVHQELASPKAEKPAKQH